MTALEASNVTVRRLGSSRSRPSGRDRRVGRDIGNGQDLLSGIDLRLPKGKIVSLIGPNGAGKSTLLSVLSGSVTPGIGQVQIEGKDVAKLSFQELSLMRAVLTQDHQVGFAFSVDEVIRMGRHPHRKTPAAAQDDRVVAEAVETMELQPLLHRRITDLSGGEQARCAIARVLVQCTPLVLLDEPMAALDLRYQYRMLTHCERLAQEGTSVVMVIHDLTLAARADLVGLVNNGCLIVDEPAAILNSKTLEQAFNVSVQIRSSLGQVDGVDLQLPARPR